jgi:signal transduction histidine kinase
MIAPRRKLYTYLAVVGLYGVVFGWWMVFFFRQSDYLLRRMTRMGVELSSEQVEALRAASDESMRMFLFEGTFLGVMLAASVALVWRSLHREISLHRQQRNFLSAVTHELKSPLASARLYIESLKMGRVPEAKQERYLTHALEDLDRLRHMVEDLLQSARLASAGPRVEPERLDLARFARERVAHIVQEETHGRGRLTVEATDPVHVEFDPDALETVVRNLVSNAVKYAGADQELVVSAQRNGHHAVLSVRDRGPGLGGADAEQIFEPFVRGGDENVRTRPGVGLGLYIVRELARAHGGQVRARDAEGGGFQVDISLPLTGAVQPSAPGQGGRAA